MQNIGLVLEGGGMRGIYTAGVLDAFMEKNCYFPYVVGVSAGACHSLSYVSKQQGRNKTVNIGYIKDPRYLSLRNYAKEKSLFGMDFMFGEIPDKLVPFDYETFSQSPQEVCVGVTDCMTGEGRFFYKSKMEAKDLFQAVRASSSLPLVSPVVDIDGIFCMDGGMAVPIPIQKAVADGYERNVVVLTRHKGYRKKPISTRMKWLLKKMYPEYQGLLKAMEARHLHYNETLQFVEEMENQHKVWVIRPAEPVQVGRLEKNTDKLQNLYETGFQDGMKAVVKWQGFL